MILHKNILIATSGFYPNPGGASYVMTTLSDELKHHGKIIIFTSKKFPTLKRLSYNGFEIFYYYNRFYHISNKLELFLSRFQKPFLMRMLKKIIRNKGIDIVVAVYPSVHLFEIAYYSARETSTSFVPYFHDAMPESHMMMEESIINYSRVVFTINEAFKNYYQQKYPDKRIEVLNFPVNVKDFKIMEDCSKDRQANGKKVAVWTGNIHGGNLNSLKRVLKAIDVINKKGDFHIIVNFLSQSNLKSQGMNYEWIIKKYILSRSDYLLELCKSDIGIVTMDWPDEGNLDHFELENALPTKVIDYMIAGTPILAHSPQHYYMSKFIKSRGAGKVVDRKSVDVIVENILSLLDGNIKYSCETLSEFLVNNVSDKFIKIMNSL